MTAASNSDARKRAAERNAAPVAVPAVAVTATMIERLAKSKYERFDSHYSMPGGLTWDEYLLDDPSGALMYVNDAADDLAAAFTEDNS